MIDQIRIDAVQIALAQGCFVKTVSDPSSIAYHHLGISLNPSPVPVSLYNHGMEVQRVMGVLYANICKDKEIIFQILSDTKDTFIRKLLEVASKAAPSQPIHFGKIRSDFMMDKGQNILQLVEYNTIASGMGSLWSQTRHIQDYLQSKYTQLVPTCEQTKQPIIGLNHCLLNSHKTQLVGAFKKAIQLSDTKSPWVLIVCEDNEINLGDQKMIELELFKSGIKCIRGSFLFVAENGSIGQDGQLIVQGHIISLVYYRTGYSDHHYQNKDGQWDDSKFQARIMLESSRAIKCPSILGQLTTYKKFQQAFSNDELLQKLLPDPEDFKIVQTLFKTMVDLNDVSDEVQFKVKDAIQNPHKYVLKPQKEGGGNNFFGQQMKQILEKGEGLEQFLLMDMINAPVLKTWMLRKGELKLVNSITEIGIFSFVIANAETGEIALNQVDGLLPRTKQADCDEGGINAGFAVMDHLIIVDGTVADLKPSCE